MLYSGIGMGEGGGGALVAAAPLILCTRYNKDCGYSKALTRNSNWCLPILKHLPTSLLYIDSEAKHMSTMTCTVPYQNLWVVLASGQQSPHGLWAVCSPLPG